MTKRDLNRIPAVLLLFSISMMTLLTFAFPLHAAEWYVDTGVGNDANPGTSGSPFKTINRALQTLNAGDTIHIGPGIYHETVVITADSDNITLIGDFNGGDSSNVILHPIGDQTNPDGYHGDGGTPSWGEEVGIKIGGDGVKVISLCVQGFPRGIHFSADYTNSIQDGLVDDVTLLQNGGGVCGFELDSSVIRRSYFEDNRVGCDLGYNISDSGTNYIQDNVFVRNYQGVHLLFSYNSVIVNNVFESIGESGIFFSCHEGTKVVGNVFQGGLWGINCFCLNGGSSLFVRNTFKSNTECGLYIPLPYYVAGSWSKIQHNNFIDQKGHAIEFLGDGIDARYNYYGTTDSSVISDSILFMGSTPLSIDFQPFRRSWVDTGPNADSIAPAVVTGLALNRTGNQVNLSWDSVTLDENGETLTGLAGYRIYRFTSMNTFVNGSIGSAYAEVDSQTTVFYDTNAGEDAYYYVVTAYDTNAPYENEGWYSAVAGAENSGEDDDNCFIASVIFGEGSREVRMLRHFRDGVLLDYRLGRVFTNLYYTHGPLLAARMKTPSKIDLLLFALFFIGMATTAGLVWMGGRGR